ncbi:MAG: S-adenosylmethionine-dependent methyltransferase, partial [Nitrospirae bacterium]
LDKRYEAGLRDIEAGSKILIVFHFHKSPEFIDEYLFQQPPHKDREFGVFSTCSPIRPNPIGVSIVEVLEVKENRLSIKGIDMIDGTPVIDIKHWRV